MGSSWVTETNISALTCVAVVPSNWSVLENAGSLESNKSDGKKPSVRR